MTLSITIDHNDTITNLQRLGDNGQTRATLIAEQQDREECRYLYTSYAGAMRQSRRVTTNPSVRMITGRHGQQLYLAIGDDWINNDNVRGTYIYGTAGRLIILHHEI
jgi:hypothetical protein